MEAFSDINDIIVRSFKKELTREDEAILKEWLSESVHNRQEYCDFESIWKESGKLSVSFKINLPQALLQTRNKAGIGRVKINLYSLAVQAAAVILLALVFSSVYNRFGRKEAIQNSELSAIQEIIAPFGTQTRLELSDGTVVFLNSGSSFKFPVSFSGEDTRHVKLSGEAFFEVAENKEKPFIVDVNSLRITVTGTRFDVNAYPGRRQVTVALASGAVSLKRISEMGKSASVTMKPEEVAIFDKTDNKLAIDRQGNLEKYINWTEGKIVFYDDNIQTVVEKLENWYNVEIEIADRKVQGYRFTGTFFDEPLSQVLDLLSISSGMEYSIIPAKKLPDNTFTKRKIIIRSKRT